MRWGRDAPAVGTGINMNWGDRLVWFFVSRRDEYCCTCAYTFDKALAKASIEMNCEPEGIRLIATDLKRGRLLAKYRL